jgi:hypothetical protein
MPYTIEPRKSGYVVVNEITGKEYEKNPISKEKAQAQKRILESVMNVPAKPKLGKTHRLNFLEDNELEDRSYSLAELSKISGVSMSTLQEVYNRGIGAYKTNPESVRIKGSFKKGPAPMSKKLSKEQWAMARVYSFLDGNPKHDNDLR